MQANEIISYGHIENQLMHPHRNPGMEIVLVEQGHLEWAVDNRPEVLTPGMVFFTLPWQPHGSMYIREPKNRIYYILFELAKPYATPSAAIRFPRCFGFSPSEEALFSRLFCGTTQHGWASSATVRQIFPTLVHLLDSPSALNTSAAMAHLRCLVLELARGIADQGTPSAKEHPSANQVRRFLQRLNGHLDESWTLDLMAKECGVGRTQFAKICQRLSGYAPYLYLSRLRFEKACELLRETTQSITDIAYQCGYGSSQYLAESFKKAARMSPSDYRKLSPQLEAILAAGWQNPECRTRDEELRRRQWLPSVEDKNPNDHKSPCRQTRFGLHSQ
jgi:AraC family L-rhamnose operon regulatory protein RhaS